MRPKNVGDNEITFEYGEDICLIVHFHFSS